MFVFFLFFLSAQIPLARILFFFLFFFKIFFIVFLFFFFFSFLFCSFGLSEKKLVGSFAIYIKAILFFDIKQVQTVSDENSNRFLYVKYARDLVRLIQLVDTNETCVVLGSITLVSLPVVVLLMKRIGAWLLGVQVGLYWRWLYQVELVTDHLIISRNYIHRRLRLRPHRHSEMDSLG